MIITKKVIVNVTSRNKTHLKEKGYDVSKDTVEINVSDLNRFSRNEIEVKCTSCENISSLKHNKYMDNVERYGFYTCRKCSTIKKKMTFNSNYGVDNPMKCQYIKEKGKKTKKDKYGDENYNNMEQHKNTCLERFGSEYALQDEDVRKKIKNTNIEKYGFEHYSKNINYITKIKNNKLLNNIKYYKKKFNLNIIDKKDNNYILLCYKCNNNFTINVNTLKGRYFSNIEICTVCNPINSISSYKELEIFNFISDNYNGEIITNTKSIIYPYELDIYLPDLKLAFEFNGVYWHNELYCDKEYHKTKTDLCSQKGIQLIHIYEDDWIYKQDIIKSMVLNKLNKNTDKIYARKCEVKKINDNKLIRKFLENNHIQGYVVSSIKLGLFYENELVSLMVFGKFRNIMKLKSNDGEYEMLRFCNKLNISVIGGASKLFKYFINNYKPKKVISYADRSYSNGNLYQKLDFNLDSITSPNYYYIVNNIKENRFNYRKSILVKKGYNPNLTEHQIMLEQKIYRIYNSGNLKFIYENK